jgi:DDE superfamily endonuclease
LSYCPRSSLPAHVLAWLADRLAHLTPPRPPSQGGTPPLSLEVRLDAVAAVLLDGLSYRRAGRMVGISKTEVGDSLDLLLGELAAVGLCQPDGTFVTTLDDLRELLVEMAAAGEAVVIGGLATRVQRPREWGNQKVLYDAKRHVHTAQGLSVSTTWGDLLWLDGGWPGSCHEQELLELSGLERVLDGVGVASLLDRGFRGLAKTREHWHAPVGDRRTRDRLSDAQRAYNRLQARLRGWWSRRSPIWQAPGRCAAGAACCTASAMSTAPPARWSASAAGCTGSPHDKEHHGNPQSPGRATRSVASGQASGVPTLGPSCETPAVST